MRKLAAAMTTLVAMLASLTGSGPAQAAADTHSALRLQPKVVTLADSGVTVVLPVGATFLLQLGHASADWRVQVADEAILVRVPGISVLRGAQGVYRAGAPGATTLTAVDVAPAPPFAVTVVVRAATPAHVRFALGEPRYTVDGLVLPMGAAPFLAQQRMYLPLRDLAAALGASDADIAWESERQVVSVRLAATQLRAQAGRHALVVNQVPIAMDAPALLRGENVWVPVRWVAEALGYQVTWDPAARVAVLRR